MKTLMILITKYTLRMNKGQVELVELVNSVFAAFDIEVPEISKGVASDLLKAFTAFTKALSSKGATKKSKKVKDPNAPKRPVNVYFAWLALYRASLRVQNGNSEDGLSDLLKSEYEKFRETSDYQKLKKECEEKMKVYKEEMSEYTTSEASGTDEDEDEDEDDDSKGKKAKKVPKAKKPEKSPEEKQPPNVYMTFRNKYLASIKANLKEGENLAEVLKEKYEEFKSTKEHNTLQEKCKADFAKWKEEKGSSSESEEAPKTAAKKTAAKEASKTSSKKEKQVDSDSDDDTFTMPKAPEKAPEKAPKIKEKKAIKKKAAKKVDSDDDE